MSNVKKPEPVAYLRSDELKKLGDPAKIIVGIHQVANSARLSAKGTKELAEQYGHTVHVVTVEQMEAHAAERVREALEQAEQAVVTLYESDDLPYLPDITRAIRALITKE